MEQLHDDLEEGIILYDQATNNVVFHNKVVKKLLNVKEEKEGTEDDVLAKLRVPWFSQCDFLLVNDKKTEFADTM